MADDAAFLEDLPARLRAAGEGLWCTGLPGGATAAALARLEGGVSVVTPTREDADRLVRALRYFRPRHGVRLYPADDTRPFEGASPDPALARERIAVRQLGDRPTNPILVLPARALLARVPREERARAVRPGDLLDRDDLLRWLCARGYLVTRKVEDPATLAVHGGHMDVWPAAASRPARIVLFDDEVESIHPFDPETQRILTRRGEVAGSVVRTVSVALEALELHPAREAVLDDATAERAAAYVHAVATERGHPGPQRQVLQDLRNGIWFPGAEAYLPALTDLVAWRPPGRLFVVEPDRVHEELTTAARKAEAHLHETPLPDRPLVRPFDRLVPPEAVDLSGAATIARLGIRAPGRTLVDFGCRDHAGLRVGSGELEPLVKQLRKWAAEGRAVTFVVESDTRADRIRALFDAHDVAFGAGRATPGTLTLDRGELPEGFTAEHLVYVTAAEVFGDKLLGETHPSGGSRASARLRTASRRSFATVKRGDLVVHSKHGVGLYSGIARLPLGVGEGDFAVLEYRDGQKLYVPLDRLDLCTPYRAVEGQAAPKLDKLGGATWDARKARVRDAVLRMASELLLLYAKRSLATAPVFEHRQELYWRFAEAFPYVETPDQETAIQEVLDDLGSGQPMDRLLVGDVGFGKTEVAMRAAMTTVLGGGQVAVLCPTSVLALQHGESFRRRFADFPVRIETISRLRTAADEREIRAAAAEGKVDVLVGTTALLSGQLRFRNLGLLVVDEEHRFGAAQKEDLKRRFGGVHTLALSATPIPRTLQMALSGIRTLSVLATPPLGRQRIRTEVVHFAPERIREDILYELRRGGQVYFVHNRVQSIDGVARWLARLVPEAVLQVAHGQMEPRTLERALHRFIRAEANVLVCTAIVESGIDLPLVNTMIINRAEQFGLAQLYQLRGRIGRGSVRGHCTVLVSGSTEAPPPGGGPDKSPARREAVERLRVLVEHDELGSNFALATRDLELRGSGEILGEKQHGHIAAIGFDAYLEMLDEAVARARGELVRQQIDPEVDVPVVSLLPDGWIPDLAERLDAYQRIALGRTRAAVRAVMAELEARYEEPPAEARNLGWLAEARIRCRELGIERFAVHKVRATLRLHPESVVPLARLDALPRELPNRFKRTGDRELEIRFTPDEGALPFRLVDWVCSRILPPDDKAGPERAVKGAAAEKKSGPQK